MREEIHRSPDSFEHGIGAVVIEHKSCAVARRGVKIHDRVSQTELFTKVRDIQYELNRIENVAKTELKGARKEQYNILVDLNKLTGYHLSLGQIVKALESLAVNVPNVKTRTDRGELVVFGVKNAIDSIEDVQNVIVAQYMGSACCSRMGGHAEPIYRVGNVSMTR